MGVIQLGIIKLRKEVFLRYPLVLIRPGNKDPLIALCTEEAANDCKSSIYFEMGLDKCITTI